VFSQNLLVFYFLFLPLLLKPRFIFTWGKCSHLWKYWQNSNSASIWHKSLLSLCAQIDIALVRRLPRLCLTFSPLVGPFFPRPWMPPNFYLWLCFHCQCSGSGISSIWQMQEAPAVLKAIFVLGTSSHLIEADTPLQWQKLWRILRLIFGGNIICGNFWHIYSISLYGFGQNPNLSKKISIKSNKLSKIH